MQLPTALFEAVVRGSVDALILHDSERLLDCNEAAVSLFGAGDREHLLDASLGALHDASEPDHRATPDHQGMASATVSRFRTLAGATFLADAMTTRIAVEGRNLFCLSVRGSTTTQAVQRVLEAHEANLRWVLDSLPGRMAWIGADRRFRYINKSFEKLSGFQPHEIIGRTVEEVIGEVAYKTVEPLGAAAMAGQVQHWEGWLAYTSAGRRYVRRTYAPSVRDDGSSTATSFSPSTSRSRRKPSKRSRRNARRSPRARS